MFTRPNPLERAIKQLNYLSANVKNSPSKEKIQKASAILLQLFYDTYRAIALRHGKVVVPYMPDYFSFKAAFPIAHYLLTIDKDTREKAIKKLVDAFIYYFTHIHELKVNPDRFLYFSEFIKRAQEIATKIGGLVIGGGEEDS